ncbi:MAG TPA: hypothetical protein PKG48_14195 [Bacteroidales bacterium]|nr:hypothetical protein [Bacteroidales bacterium]HPS61599.1 hypothetical protein [Bacteroidales bacterium]
MKKIKLILILTAILALPLISLPDPPGPPGSGTPGSTQGGGQTPVGAPIDGGVGILLALGLGYGGKKLYTARKEHRASLAKPEN